MATVCEGTPAKQGVAFASFLVHYQLIWVNTAVGTHVFQFRFPVGEPSVSNGFEDGIDSILLVDTKLLLLSRLKFSIGLLTTVVLSKLLLPPTELSPFPTV